MLKGFQGWWATFMSHDLASPHLYARAHGGRHSVGCKVILGLQMGSRESEHGKFTYELINSVHRERLKDGGGMGSTVCACVYICVCVCMCVCEREVQITDYKMIDRDVNRKTKMIMFFKWIWLKLLIF